VQQLPTDRQANRKIFTRHDALCDGVNLVAVDRFHLPRLGCSSIHRAVASSGFPNFTARLAERAAIEQCGT